MVATLQEIKQRCYLPKFALNIAQMVHQCSICLEKQMVDLLDWEVFNRGTTKVWEHMHMDLIRPNSPPLVPIHTDLLDLYSRHVAVILLEDKWAETVA